jgi:23S rRNA (cytosine1962-C5)-methyltransferase
LERMDESFDVVIADPPAFVRSKKDLGAGLRGYRKLMRLAAGRVAPGGFLFAASCSHHVTPEAFAQELARALVDAGRAGRVIASMGAGPDHPVHPMLPESAYLKSVLVAL